MKNSWHDIPPADKWQHFLSQYTLSVEQTVRREVLVKKIHHYHLINKKCQSDIELRQEALNEIAQLAKDFVTPESNELDKLRNALQSLSNNASQKSDYLRQLKEHLEKSKYLDKKALLERLGRHKNTPEVLRLFEGTLLERMDPAHRSFEFSAGELTKKSFNNSAELLMNEAFFEWVKSEDITPFFLWLEAHHLVTNPPRHIPSDPKSDFIDRSVKYEAKEAVNVIFSAERLIISDEKQNQIEPLNTAKLKKQSFKIGGRLGSAAFIWNNIQGENQFFTHPHESRKYHHSTLSQGKKVSCAGMWYVENGKIEEINNNSGHYRPTSLNFYLLIRELVSNGVMARHAEVADLRRVVSNKGLFFFGGSSSTYQPLPKYLAWAESLPEVKDYLNDKNIPFLSTLPNSLEGDNPVNNNLNMYK